MYGLLAMNGKAFENLHVVSEAIFNKTAICEKSDY